MKIKLPKGFLAGGIHCGLKKKRKDLSLFYSEAPCKCAAVFTRNKVKAAPVVLSEKQLKKAKGIRAVIVNSGNANCMTGKRGLVDAAKMAKKAAASLKISQGSVLVSSTGVIGEPIKMVPIIRGMPKLVKGLSPYGTVNATDGIMTTDSFRKISSAGFTIGGKKVRIVGVAKGAGMIDPNMATMLSYILTDANITKGALKKAFSLANEDSFNAITVDGQMSTNDTVMLLANGGAKNKMIGGEGRDFDIFLKNLKAVTLALAKMIVRDGEGATKLIEVKVKGAKTKKEAQKAAKAIANSLLVKCAVHGGDPNWGRVAAAVGSSGVGFNLKKMKIAMDGLKRKNVKVRVHLGAGREEATVYTCDISKKYIAINSYYRT